MRAAKAYSIDTIGSSEGSSMRAAGGVYEVGGKVSAPPFGELGGCFLSFILAKKRPCGNENLTELIDEIPTATGSHKPYTKTAPRSNEQRQR